MEWYLLYSIVFMAVIVWLIMKYFYLPISITKALSLPKEAERYAHDSIKSAEAIGEFLKERAEVTWIKSYDGVEPYTHVSSRVVTKFIFAGRDAEVVTFIRRAHSAGYEVVVREWTGSGLEEMKTEEEKRAEAKKKQLEDKLDELGI